MKQITDLKIDFIPIAIVGYMLLKILYQVVFNDYSMLLNFYFSFVFYLVVITTYFIRERLSQKIFIALLVLGTFNILQFSFETATYRFGIISAVSKEFAGVVIQKWSLIMLVISIIVFKISNKQEDKNNGETLGEKIKGSMTSKSEDDFLS